MYEKGINEHQIINLLALGSFGIQINRKLVPTRWAISAYDRTIDNYLFKKIINYKLIERYEIYHYYDKGNDFIIILTPDPYCGEVIEHFPGTVGHDYFNNFNKLSTSDPNNGGGYYATKIAVNEFLEKRKNKLL